MPPCGSRMTVAQLRVAVKAKQPNLAVSRLNKTDLLDFYEGKKKMNPVIPKSGPALVKSLTAKSKAAMASGKKAPPKAPKIPAPLKAPPLPPMPPKKAPPKKAPPKKAPPKAVPKKAPSKMASAGGGAVSGANKELSQATANIMKNVQNAKTYGTKMNKLISGGKALGAPFATALSHQMAAYKMNQGIADTLFGGSGATLRQQTENQMKKIQQLNTDSGWSSFMDAFKQSYGLLPNIETGLKVPIYQGRDDNKFEKALKTLGTAMSKVFDVGAILDNDGYNARMVSPFDKFLLHYIENPADFKNKITYLALASKSAYEKAMISEHTNYDDDLFSTRAVTKHAKEQHSKNK